MAEAVKTGTILDRIVEARRHSCFLRQKLIPLNMLRMTIKRNDPPRDFAGAISRDAINVVAELKKASPSRGVLKEDFNPVALAKQFTENGAAALSILTEEEFFQGALENIGKARKSAPLPALRKDFLFDPWQVWESRASNADSFLLIVAILEDASLKEMIALGRELDMEPLVEVHTRAELHRALDAGARVIGVNNRDLRTFELSLETSLDLIDQIPDECIAVCESGIHSRADIERLRAAGYDAFLVGEHLMQAADPGAALRVLVG
jgi:indole-3-glycerol phosphate synthase